MKVQTYPGYSNNGHACGKSSGTDRRTYGC